MMLIGIGLLGFGIVVYVCIEISKSPNRIKMPYENFMKKKVDK
jgi:hypothetical protein